jgi:hypothetical protein
MTNLYFPPQGDPLISELPSRMVFYCADYSTWNSKRNNAAIKAGTNVTTITVPYPKVFAVNNDMNYGVGGSLVQEMRNLEFIAQANVEAWDERKNIFKQGGSAILPDHMETFLMPGSRRKYAISFDMIAKTEAQAKAATEIANTFQTKTFPSWNGRNALVWQHPPLWCITVLGLANDQTAAWDGNALPCVLKNVDINRAPILTTPFMTDGGYPLALNIELTFHELEPAVAYRGELTNRATVFKPT